MTDKSYPAISSQNKTGKEIYLNGGDSSHNTLYDFGVWEFSALIGTTNRISSSFPSLSSIKFFDSKLDEAQQRAVCKVIDAKDIALIQGPPGTGKTNVIVEVIRQIIYYNKRNPIVTQKVLIVSQSHAAVDKILEDLDPYLNETNVIRVGSDENFSEWQNKNIAWKTEKKLWIEKIIDNSKLQLLHNLAFMKIKQEDFDIFANALENIKIVNNTEQDTANCQKRKTLKSTL